ncbi:hypothetical protein [Macrococcus animalis]|uniref:hypothetical protein n=1 Tax=Macrococcus animalis TaxID=3395467 RepID=UPI0039BDD8DD
MKPIFTFENSSDVEKYRNDILIYHNRMNDYQEYLESNFQLYDIPKGVFWTSSFVMAKVLNKSVPAFTRDEAIYMCADHDYWKDYFINLLPDEFKQQYTDFYHKNTKNEILAIFGHELTHHVDLFLAEFDEENPTCEDMWFEEGMATYLPRKFFFDDTLFNEIYKLELSLYEHYVNEFGDLPLENFTYDIYSYSNEYIMYHYWISFVKITQLVDHVNGDVAYLLKLYHDWDAAGRTVSLSHYFEENI